MTLQAMWMRKNMLQSTSRHERQMSENEMRVLRSIQKLSIPDWYLNNSSRPPKILSHDTPIDMRRPSWKKLPLKKSLVSETAVVSTENSTVSHNGILETEIGRSSIGNESPATWKNNKISPTKKSPSSHRQDSKSDKNADKLVASKSEFANVSQTFPRVSPSRKIQNINIVFPQQSENSKHLMVTDLDEVEIPVVDMIRDSLDVKKSSAQIKDRYEDTAISSEVIPMHLRERKILQSPKRQLASIKPWEPSSTHTDVKFRVPIREQPAEESFKLRGSPIRHRSSVSIVTSSGAKERASFRISNMDATSGEEEWNQPSKSSLPNEIFALDAKIKFKGKSKAPLLLSVLRTTSPMERLKAPISWRTRESNVTSEGEKCDVCRASRQQHTSTPRVGFQPKNLLPSIPEKILDPLALIKINSNNSSGEPFFNSTKKSSELERIVKSKQRSRLGKSLVSEIIEELNEKCKISSESTYVSPVSKNFVRKLVTALENGLVPSSEQEQEKEREENYYENLKNRRVDEVGEDYEEDVFIDSDNDIEDGIKSAAVSTSISYTDSSSDSDIGLPTIEHDYDKYDWKMSVNKNNGDQKTNNNGDKVKNKNHGYTIPRVVENEDDEVYWNPITKHNLPRTSSLLSGISRVSSSSTRRMSPCISPIDRTNDPEKVYSPRPGGLFNNGWAATYRANEEPSKRLWPVNEATILDSGYSEKSSTRSSRSPYAGHNKVTPHWFDYTETTLTASEIDSCYSEFSQTSQSKKHRQTEVRVRPFVI